MLLNNGTLQKMGSKNLRNFVREAIRKSGGYVTKITNGKQELTAGRPKNRVAGAVIGIDATAQSLTEFLCLLALN